MSLPRRFTCQALVTTSQRFVERKFDAVLGFLNLVLPPINPVFASTNGGDFTKGWTAISSRDFDGLTRY
jgi:hypothetical protein